MIPIHSEDDMALQANLIAEKYAANTNAICLNGPLGAGKTSFARALIRHLTKTPDLHVPSPTFTLVQTYDGWDREIHHFDLYRINDPDEIFELGWDDALADGLCIIEWPERLGPHIPKQRLDIHIKTIPDSQNARTLWIEELS